MELLDADVYALLVCAGLLLALVAVVQSSARSLLAWACLVAFFALAWNAVALAGWFA